MKRNVRVGAIFAAVVATMLAVTVIFRGPPKPFLMGLSLVLLFAWAIRALFRRLGPRRH